MDVLLKTTNQLSSFQSRVYWESGEEWKNCCYSRVAI